MKVYKFGGASVKDAKSIINVGTVLKTMGYKDTFMVVSAMGKTTNALEVVIQKYFEQADFKKEINKTKSFHLQIAQDLQMNSEVIKNEIIKQFEDLEVFLQRNKSPNFDFVYDQVVSYGELVSTKILSLYLNAIGIYNEWIDVRKFLKTDDTYREGKVNWTPTKQNFNNLEAGKFYITQGFLGSDDNNFTTTLGREGSDFTAAIIANCLEAESLTIWKDVPGVLNADPRHFDNPQLLEEVSYEEAIELAYYGASVIHPKTMKPLRQKQIPFFVKSFLNPEADGTRIHNNLRLKPYIPCFILKQNQTLMTLTTKDFSFISEDKISRVFNLLNELNIKVNLMQNSAITLSLCLEDKFHRLNKFQEKILTEYEIESEKDVSLYTVRNFKEEEVFNYQSVKGKVLLRQIIKNTLQIIVKQ